MGRLRARMARSDIDKDLHGRLAAASKHLEQARDVCTRAGRDAGLSSVEKDRVVSHRFKVMQALALIDSIGHVSGYGDVDPDLMPEAEKKPRREQPERFGKVT